MADQDTEHICPSLEFISKISFLEEDFVLLVLKMTIYKSTKALLCIASLQLTKKFNTNDK